MDEIYARFSELLAREDKAGAVRYAISVLEDGKIGVSDLYELVLAPLLNGPICAEGDESCIWREHVRTSIVRAIVEISYPYVLKAKDVAGFIPVGVTVLVVCPQEEYHELGARMAADFFELAGFDVKYVGANTPNRDILSAVRHVAPDIVAVSVTDYYNLVRVKTLIGEILSLRPEAKIVLGGGAFVDPDHVACVGNGRVLRSFADITAFAAEVRT
jgi:methanogenic corrinoid protein MtbC1